MAFILTQLQRSAGIALGKRLFQVLTYPDEPLAQLWKHLQAENAAHRFPCIQRCRLPAGFLNSVSMNVTKASVARSMFPGVRSQVSLGEVVKLTKDIGCPLEESELLHYAENGQLDVQFVGEVLMVDLGSLQNLLICLQMDLYFRP